MKRIGTAVNKCAFNSTHIFHYFSWSPRKVLSVSTQIRRYNHLREDCAIKTLLNAYKKLLFCLNWKQIWVLCTKGIKNELINNIISFFMTSKIVAIENCESSEIGTWKCNNKFKLYFLRIFNLSCMRNIEKIYLF